MRERGLEESVQGCRGLLVDERRVRRHALQEAHVEAKVPRGGPAVCLHEEVEEDEEVKESEEQEEEVEEEVPRRAAVTARPRARARTRARTHTHARRTPWGRATAPVRASERQSAHTHVNIPSVRTRPPPLPRCPGRGRRRAAAPGGRPSRAEPRGLAQAAPPHPGHAPLPLRARERRTETC